MSSIESYVDGFTASDFAAYYLTALVVSQASFTWIMWEMEYWIRQGNLSPLRVRPVHPIHQHIANNLTFKLLTMAVVVPVVVVLTIVLEVPALWNISVPSELKYPLRP